MLAKGQRHYAFVYACTSTCICVCMYLAGSLVFGFTVSNSWNFCSSVPQWFCLKHLSSPQSLSFQSSLHLTQYRLPSTENRRSWNTTLFIIHLFLDQVLQMIFLSFLFHCSVTWLTFPLPEFPSHNLPIWQNLSFYFSYKQCQLSYNTFLLFLQVESNVIYVPIALGS